MSEDEYEYEDYEEGWDNATALEYSPTLIAFSEEDESENEEEIKENQVESEEEEEEEEEKGNYDEIEWVLSGVLLLLNNDQILFLEREVWGRDTPSKNCLQL